MHLCSVCTDLREWATDPVVRTQMDLNERRPLENRHRCATCREMLRVPFFRVCARCALRERQCQHCGKSTLSAEEQAAANAAAIINEEFERLLDDYTLVVKCFGISSKSAKFFRERYGGSHEGALTKIIAPGQLDNRLSLRPLLAYLYCERPPIDPARLYCDGCEDEERSSAFAAAKNCGHFVLARDQALCLSCALETKHCSACGASTAPPAID